jgi:putative GTP pyrophosphokinase
MAADRRRLKITIETLAEQYEVIAPSATRPAAELVRQVEHLLGDEGVLLGFPIQVRVKSWRSIAEKLQRVGLDFQNLRDLQDLVGVRVILLFRRDLERACTAIERNFRIRKQYDTQERLGADQFGYSSRHFVVDIPESWLTVPTMSGLGDLGAEIQVRTLAQHIWAEASQALQYKVEESIPLPIRRAVARTAALLETVDLELERVLEEREQYRRTLPEQDKDEPLNVDVIEQTLDQLLPAEHKAPGLETYSLLLEELAHVSISTQHALEVFVREHLEDAIKESAVEAKWHRDRLLKSGKPLSPKLEQGIYFIHTGLVRVMLRAVYPEQMEELWALWRRRRGQKAT